MSEESREVAVSTRWNQVKPTSWGDSKYRDERAVPSSLLEEGVRQDEGGQAPLDASRGARQVLHRGRPSQGLHPPVSDLG